MTNAKSKENDMGKVVIVSCKESPLSKEESMRLGRIFDFPASIYGWSTDMIKESYEGPADHLGIQESDLEKVVTQITVMMWNALSEGLGLPGSVSLVYNAFSESIHHHLLTHLISIASQTVAFELVDLLEKESAESMMYG